MAPCVIELEGRFQRSGRLVPPLPRAIDTGSDSPQEFQLVQPYLGYVLTEEQPDRVIGDKAHDSG